MGYSKRIETLCSLLVKADVFADVGCDHGYCSEYMLKNELCSKVIFSDVSKGSLQKAQTLLADYVAEGKAVPVLGDGFFGVDRDVDEVLIAGMGGSEIVEILSDERYGFIPKRFVFQPMHDAEKLRRYLLKNGAVIERDFTFFDGKFYDVICGKNQETTVQVQEYSDAEYEFGRENLEKMPAVFSEKIKKQIQNTEKYLSQPALQEESRMALEARKKRLTEVLYGEIK